MAKRRHKQKVENQVSPSLTPSKPSILPDPVLHIENQMRGLLKAARAPRARRFVIPSKVQSRINEIIRSEVEHAPIRRTKNHRSERDSRPVLGADLSGRNPLHKSPVLQEKLPEPVRDVLLDSERALECTRRETRREIMFAMHRTGKGGKKNKQARWTEDSYISCKR